MLLFFVKLLDVMSGFDPVRVIIELFQFRFVNNWATLSPKQFRLSISYVIQVCTLSGRHTIFLPEQHGNLCSNISFMLINKQTHTYNGIDPVCELVYKPEARVQ